MGLESSKNLPIEQINIGDTIVKPSWGGLFKERLEVVDIDEGRRYAMACDRPSDALFIVKMFQDSSAMKSGTSLPAKCSCSTYLNTPLEKRHFMARGWD